MVAQQHNWVDHLTFSVFNLKTKQPSKHKHKGLQIFWKVSFIKNKKKCDITVCKKNIFQIWTTEKRKNAWSPITDPESLKCSDFCN